MRSPDDDASPPCAHATAGRRDRGEAVRFVLVLACFFASGAAGLVYEIAWSRQLSVIFGSGALGATAVLAAYFGGLAAGGLAARRALPRVRRPLRLFALLELGTALGALTVPWLLGLAARVHAHLAGPLESFPASEGLPTGLSFFASSFVVLLAPTLLMGATLPVLAAYAVRRDHDLRGRIGLLYAVNTAGATIGCLAAAFVLLPALGLLRTTLVGVGANVAIFVAALVLARGERPVRAAAPAVIEIAPPRTVRRVLALCVASSAIMFAFEVLWTRLLVHVLGDGIQAFATMLAGFLVGIAAGAAVATRFAGTPGRAVTAYVWTQIGAGVFSLLAFHGIDLVPALLERLRAAGLPVLAVGAASSILILLPAAFCMGATFPLAVRVIARGSAEAGPVTGLVAAGSTIGSVLGAMAAGFLLLPAFGFDGTLELCTAATFAVAAAAALLLGAPRRPGLVGSLAALATLAACPPPIPWDVLRASPASRRAGGRVVVLDVGRHATVLLLEHRASWSLRTDGLPQASIRKRTSPDDADLLSRWLGGLAVHARPDARTMAVIGLGGGASIETVPQSIESIDVFELEPAVVAANRTIAARRRVDPLADPRVTVHVADARSALARWPGAFDTIVSQPSHPWTSGAAHLHTREFFATVRDRLGPDGAFVMWMGRAFADEDLLRSLAATLLEIFADARLYEPEPGSLLFVATAGSVLDTAATGNVLPEADVSAALLMDGAELARFAAGAPIITDDRNLVAMHAQSRARRTR